MTTAQQDWRERFQIGYSLLPQVAWKRSERGVLLSTLEGTAQLYAWSPQTGEMRRLTNLGGGWFGPFAIAPDGSYIVYLKDQFGNNMGHFHKVDYETGLEEDLTPAAGPFPGLPVELSRDGRWIGMVGAGQDGFRAYLLDLQNNHSLTELCHSPSLIIRVALSADGTIAAVASSARSSGPHYSLIAYDTTGKQINELWDGPNTSVELVGFSRRPGDQRAMVMTNKSGFNTLAIWDPATGKCDDLHLEVEGLLQSADWHSELGLVLLNTHDKGKQQLIVHDLNTNLRQRVSPTGVFMYPYLDESGAILATFSNSISPWRPIRIEAGSVKSLIKDSRDIPGSPELSVEFETSDGAVIQGWLMKPTAQRTPGPAIIDLHGGPADVNLGGFAATSQALCDHGVARLSINYRGSTTFGRDFEQCIVGRLGELETRDILAARQYLIDNQIAAPDQIFVAGNSYGGYLSLYAIGRHPDLFAGAIAEAVIGDWTGFYNESDPIGKSFISQYLGGSPEDRPAQYSESSPITYAKEVNCPVLIFQGSNDTRTPKGQAESYIKALEDYGKDVQVHWYNHGHGARDVATWIRFTEIKLDFIRKITRSW